MGKCEFRPGCARTVRIECHLQSAGEWSDVSVSFNFNTINLICVMLPGVRQDFNVDY